MRVKGHLRAFLALQELVPERRRRVAHASRQPMSADPIRQLSERLHPRVQHLVVEAVRDETPRARTYRLVPEPDSPTQEIAYFRAGQYLSLNVAVDGVEITRPYSISSAPCDALQGYCELTIQRTEGGFFTGHVWEHWTVGTRLSSSGPSGLFYHDPLRDSRRVVGLAGGSGITPFRSMAREIAHGESDMELLLLYGSEHAGDIIFRQELEELSQASPRIRVVHVLSGEGETLARAEQGLITAELIQKHADPADCSFFVCGSRAMHHFVTEQLAQLRIPRRRIRREVFGAVGDGAELADFPQHNVGKTFQIRARHGLSAVELAASATESVLVALERAKLRPPSSCRSGECGLCRARLLSGEVFVAPEGDRRRSADVRGAVFHLCNSFPMGDLEIEIP